MGERKKSIIIEYLNNLKKLTLNNKQINWLDYLLKNGELFYKKDIILNKNCKVQKLNVRRKQCFYNSQFINILNNGVFYYEGYYVCSGIGFPFEHGFNVFDGKVLDVTAEKYKINVMEYFGLYIPHRFIMKQLNKTQSVNSLLVDYIFSKIGK